MLVIKHYATSSKLWLILVVFLFIVLYLLHDTAIVNKRKSELNKKRVFSPIKSQKVKQKGNSNTKDKQYNKAVKNSLKKPNQEYSLSHTIYRIKISFIYILKSPSACLQLGKLQRI